MNESTSQSTLVSPTNPVVTAGPSPLQVNIVWAKQIPKFNFAFMVASVLLIVLLDYGLASSIPDLMSFFVLMLYVLAVFVVFYIIENRWLKAKFSNSESKLDSWFVFLIVIRDFVFLLNFIPGIQLLGMTALGFIGIPYLVIYLIMLIARFKSIPAVARI